MDTELVKMFLTVLNQIIDKLPVGVSGFVGAALVGYILHKWKRLPYKIMRIGTNGSTQITSDMLEKNCTEYHGPLDEKLMRQDAKLDSIYERQTTVLSEMSNIRGYLEGSKRQPAGRR